MYFHSVRMYLHIVIRSIFALVMFLIGWNLLGGSIGVLPSLSSIFLHCVLKTMMEKNNTFHPRVRNQVNVVFFLLLNVKPNAMKRLVLVQCEQFKVTKPAQIQRNVKGNHFTAEPSTPLLLHHLKMSHN